MTAQCALCRMTLPGPSLFEREVARIRAVLGDRILALEHVGSTSIPGLIAKPIIDIVLAVSDSANELAYVPDLEAAGYRLVIREPAWHEHQDAQGSRHGHPPARVHGRFDRESDG